MLTLSILALVGILHTVFSQEVCNVPPLYRRECGYVGITAETCEKKGCCFDSTIQGAKWCYRKAEPECWAQPTYRRECGWPGISAEECEERGCCFNSNTNVDGAKWCFNKTAGFLATPCNVPPLFREECGYVGIKEDVCEARACCYDNSVIAPDNQAVDPKFCFKDVSRECWVIPKFRQECGWPGISQATCEAKGCCYNSNSNDAIWCFKKMSDPCDVLVKDRRACGYSGIPQKTCEDLGCCFNSTIFLSAWCFHKNA